MFVGFAVVASAIATCQLSNHFSDGPNVADEVTVIDLPGCDEHLSSSTAAPLTEFVAGDENRLAVVALEELLSAKELPSDNAWLQPLVLTGPSGSGKSHLARGITRHWSRQLGESEVAYFTAIDFARELHSARIEGQLELFRCHVASLRLLVIEDLQQLPRRAFVEREFRDTLDHLAESGCIVLITARELSCTDPGLCDRLQSGLCVRLALPGVPARREILSRVARTRDIALTDDQLQQISQQTDGPAPRLTQALAKFDLSAELAMPVTEEAASRHTLKQIMAVVARYYAVTQAALKSSARRKSLVHARGVIVYLARLLSNFSYADIGRALGGRDHSTIIHAHRTILGLAATDSTTQHDLDELKRILTAG